MSREHSPLFFVPPSAISSGRLFIEGDEARHLAVVRRAASGDIIHVTNGSGSIMKARVDLVDRNRVSAEIVESTKSPKPSPQVVLYQALPKSGKLEFAIGKSVEIGVDEIVVFVPERSVPRWDETKSLKAAERWNAVAAGAAKQSRSAWIPRVEGPMGVVAAAERATAGGNLVLVAHESAADGLRDSLPREAPDVVCIVVGPEGGLSASDVGEFERKGGVAVSLGPRIMRTETAGLAAAAAILFQYGRLG